MASPGALFPDLADQWAGHNGWTILDATGQGDTFARIYQQLLASEPAKQPGVLHYVMCVACIGRIAPGNDVQRDILDKVKDWSHALPPSLLQDIANELQHLRSGFNRILLQGGRISLTVCVGDIAETLKAQRMQAQTVLLSADCETWTDLHWKLLALNCAAGAEVYASAQCNPESALVGATATATAKSLRASIAKYGFVPSQAESSTFSSLAIYRPRWRPKLSRRFVNSPVSQGMPGTCAVIGGGLSGAACARALALRGWQVTVFDALDQPAGAASGLPVGLCVPLTSTDDNPLSRLTAQGVRITLAFARAHLQAGSDWQLTGVLEKGDAATATPDELHRHAAWIKPAALVRALLEHPGISWRGNARISALRRAEKQWQLADESCRLLGQSDMVVFANAYGCRALTAGLPAGYPLIDVVLHKLAALQPLDGTLSLGPFETVPSQVSIPVNGSGSWIPAVPIAAGTSESFWTAGATYETPAAALPDLAARHADNLHKLGALSPQAAQIMKTALDSGTARHWSGTRCVTHDRLPLVGPLDAGDQPTLWICAGMGSRGLSLAMLSAQLLAAYVGTEPLPLGDQLAKSLRVTRPLKGSKAQTLPR